MNAITAKAPIIPTLLAVRPAPAVTIGIEAPVLAVGAEPAPEPPELVGVTVARPRVVFAADDTVLLL